MGPPLLGSEYNLVPHTHRWPKFGRKLHGRTLSRVQELLDQRVAMREIARRVGISEATVRSGLRSGRLTSPKATKQEAPTACQEEASLRPFSSRHEDEARKLL